jgi:hypothetical protein
MLEQAQRAVRVVKQVAGTTLSEARTLARSTGRSFEDLLYGVSPKISQDSWLRMRLNSASRRIASDNIAAAESRAALEDATWSA